MQVTELKTLNYAVVINSSQTTHYTCIILSVFVSRFIKELITKTFHAILAVDVQFLRELYSLQF